MICEADTLVGVLRFSPDVSPAKLERAVEKLQNGPHARNAGFCSLAVGNDKASISFIYKLGCVHSITEQTEPRWIQTTEAELREQFFPDFICGEYGHDSAVLERPHPGLQ